MLTDPGPAQTCPVCAYQIRLEQYVLPPSIRLTEVPDGIPHLTLGVRCDECGWLVVVYEVLDSRLYEQATEILERMA